MKKHRRNSDPRTSHQSARELSNKDTMIRVLLKELEECPGTPEDLCIRAGYTPADGAWKRVSDLKDLGYAKGTGVSIRGSSGRRQEVVQITARGRRAL